MLIIPNNYVEVNMIDVGQGDAIHIKTKHKKNILIDSGGSEQSDYDVGEKVLIPYLLDNSSGIIDLLIISHFHEDHAEGAITLLRKCNVKQIVIGTQPKLSPLYEELLIIAKEKNISIYTLTSGQSFSFDGINFYVLYPKKELNIVDDLNNNSLVISVDILDTSILFTGDTENLEEEELLKLSLKNQKLLDVDILKVGHHGSKGSSTEEFLKKVSPQISLISCGVKNKFGHPHEAALERLKKYTKVIYRTDLCGEISLKIYPHKKISVETMIES